MSTHALLASFSVSLCTEKLLTGVHTAKFILCRWPLSDKSRPSLIYGGRKAVFNSCIVL